MSGSGRKRPPLVADRRYPAAGGRPRNAARPPQKPQKPRKPKKPARKTGKTRQSRARRRLPRLIAWPLALIRWIFRLTWRLILGSAVAVTAVVALAVIYYASTMPPLSAMVDGRARGSVTMLDRHGEIFAWRGEQFGGIITPDSVSPHLKNAIIATEDKRFYRHFGVSPRGIASAMRINIREGRSPLSGNGGSTLTQQVAKLVCMGQPFDPKRWESERA